MTPLRLAATAALFSILPLTAAAQTCPCPPEITPGWHGSAGLGYALTAGNTDTRSLNLAADAKYDPKKKNVVKLDAAYLRASTDGLETAANSAAGVRDEYALGKRSFLFGEARYQRDVFKELDYMIKPAVGGGYKLVTGEKVQWDWDAGVGLVFEKLEDRDGTTSGSVQTGEALAWNISKTSKLTHLARAVWKMDDFSDAYYHFEAGLTASLVRRIAMKVAFTEDIKNKPASPELKKNDETLVASLLFKF